MPTEDNSTNIHGNVNGDNIAIGGNAKATKITNNGIQGSMEDFTKALTALRSGVDSLGLAQPAREVVEEDLQKLEESASQKTPDKDAINTTLLGLATKLKMVGIVVAEVTALTTPLIALAKVVGISLKAIGIG